MNQWIKLATGLKAMYSNERFMPDEMAVKMWYGFMKEHSYEAINAACIKYIANNKFPPTPADILELIGEIEHPESVKGWEDGWEEVIHGIRYYGGQREEEALSDMNELTRQAVKRIGWQNICYDENIAATRANFRMAYESLMNRKKADDALPMAVRERIKQLQQQAVPMIE